MSLGLHGYRTQRILGRYSFILLYGLLIIAVVWFVTNQSHCSFPLPYQIGSVDARFNISERELLDFAKQAESIWESGLGRDVLEFDPQKGLPINLIFDQRQRRTNDLEKANTTLTTLENKRADIQDDLTSLRSQYDMLLEEYVMNTALYEQQVEAFNRTVEFWNKRAGAPKDVYASIIKEQQEIESLRAQLELDQKHINNLVARLNNTVQDDAKIVNEYNYIIDSFEVRYGEATLFDRAEFNNERINIYEFDDEDVLILSLVHELGHYLGISHVDETQAIMYYLMQDQDLENIQVTHADIKAFEAVCAKDSGTIKGRFNQFKNYLQDMYKMLF